MVKSVFTKQFASFRRILIAERKGAGVTQVELAERLSPRGLDMTQSVISKVERGERRLDVVEFIYFMRALGRDPTEVIAKVEAAFPRSGTKKRR